MATNTAPQITERGLTGTGTAGPGTGRYLARRKRSRRILLFAVIGLIVIAGGILLYRYFASYESTDDAEIDGYIYPVSTRVTG